VVRRRCLCASSPHHRIAPVARSEREPAASVSGPSSGPSPPAPYRARRSASCPLGTTGGDLVPEQPPHDPQRAQQPRQPPRALHPLSPTAGPPGRASSRSVGASASPSRSRITRRASSSRAAASRMSWLRSRCPPSRPRRRWPAAATTDPPPGRRSPPAPGPERARSWAVVMSPLLARQAGRPAPAAPGPPRRSPGRSAPPPRICRRRSTTSVSALQRVAAPAPGSARRPTASAPTSRTATAARRTGLQMRSWLRGAASIRHPQVGPVRPSPPGAPARCPEPVARHARPLTASGERLRLATPQWSKSALAGPPPGPARRAQR
jgi:hypothetical protein